MTETERFLARALMEIMISIDMSDDDDIDPDVATGLMEPVAALLQGASSDVRNEIVALFGEFAESESISERRETALDLPSALGLT